MRKLAYVGMAAGMGMALGLLPLPRARAAVETLNTCQVNPPAAEGPCHPVLGFGADIPVTIATGGANIPVAVSLGLRLGADLTLSHDPATFAPGGSATLGLTYTPTDDPGPELILDVDSQTGTLTSGSHTLSLPATHLIAAAMNFVGPLDGAPPVSVPLAGDTMTVCLETDIGCIDVLDITLGGTLTVSVQPAPCSHGLLDVILGGAASVLCPCTNATVQSPPFGLLDWGMAGQTLAATIKLPSALPTGATIGPVLTPLIHWVHVDAELNATIDGSGILSFIGTTTIPLIGRGGKVAENLGDALTSFGLVDAIAAAAGPTIGPLIKPVVAMGNIPVPLLDPELPLITNTQSLTLNLGTVAFTLPGGRCAGVTCTAQDECHDVGTCEPATGRCSNPLKMQAAIEAFCQGQGLGCTNAPDHRHYVQCISSRIKAEVKNGTLPPACKAVTRCAARSTCGKKAGSVTCCITNAKGKTKCTVKSSASACEPPKGGQACVGSFPSCCDACTTTGCAGGPTTTSTTLPSPATPFGGLECPCTVSSDCHSSDPCCCVGLAGGNECTLQGDCAIKGGNCECNAGDVQLFAGVCPGTPCGVDSQCSVVEFCTGGVCTLKQPKDGECAFSSGCLDGCCCAAPGDGSPTCDRQSECATKGGACECSAGDAHLFGGVCPGTPCSVDSQCSSIEFCTDNVCTLKETSGGSCSFSSGCVDSCCCSVAGVAGNVCSGQTACAASGGTCQCAAGDAQLFGGVCPGTPCGQDSQCSSVEFCTGGVCTLKQPGGGPCAFSSGCDDLCCCSRPGASPTCGGQNDCFNSGGTCECSAGDAHLFGGICPGTPCGQDNQCSSVEFCTGGVCTLKQPSGGGCAFSSGCFDACCCALGGSNTCSLQGGCAESGGSCECSGGDAHLFGGICPGTPCGQDNQCSSVEFCTGGACTLKLPGGGPCSFSSGCLDGCCCDGTCTFRGSCTGTCLP